MLSDWLKVLKSSKKFKVCNQSEIQDDCTAIQRFYMGPIWENHFSQKSGIGLNPNGTLIITGLSFAKFEFFCVSRKLKMATTIRQSFYVRPYDKIKNYIS